MNNARRRRSEGEKNVHLVQIFFLRLEKVNGVLDAEETFQLRFAEIEDRFAREWKQIEVDDSDNRRSFEK